MQTKVVLVTGAARRIGAEIARHLHAAGASVVVHYRSSADDATALVTEFNRQRPESGLLLQADLRDFWRKNRYVHIKG